MVPKDTGPRRRTSWRYVGHAPLAYLDFIDSGTLWNGPLEERIALLEGLARRVPREAGLPDRLCHCVPAEGGWPEAAPDELPAATDLLDVVERAPHGWLERAAVRMLGHADAVRRAVAAGDAQAATNDALTLALQAGGLALAYEFGPDLRAGQRQRMGGSKGGRQAREESEAVERHRRWAEEDARLETRGKRPAERARLIAKRHSANVETVRATVRRFRRIKSVSEAPASPDG
ncbi:MAG TPA: hypothetical protein VFG47_03015 [Geminicoccaceae bacterium]|nr:hypothetical protein [Geminicoccaceae bacterium]